MSAVLLGSEIKPDYGGLFLCFVLGAVLRGIRSGLRKVVIPTVLLYLRRPAGDWLNMYQIRLKFLRFLVLFVVVLLVKLNICLSLQLRLEPTVSLLSFPFHYELRQLGLLGVHAYCPTLLLHIRACSNAVIKYIFEFPCNVTSDDLLRLLLFRI